MIEENRKKEERNRMENDQSQMTTTTTTMKTMTTTTHLLCLVAFLQGDHLLLVSILELSAEFLQRSIHISGESVMFEETNTEMIVVELSGWIK